MPAVSVIVHLDGGRETARRCLEALAGLADEPTFEAVIVDDASPDLAELLAALSGDVKVLRMERRSGFLASAIAGAESATSDTLVLLRDAPPPPPLVPPAVPPPPPPPRAPLWCRPKNKRGFCFCGPSTRWRNRFAS